jgi:putative NADH-flavin reductase
MRLLVLGSEGVIGRYVVERALGHGHEVTVLTPADTPPTPPRERLRVLAGSALAPDTLGPAVDGQDAVAIALEPKPSAEVHVYSDTAANTIRAMTARGVRRLVVVSAAGAAYPTGTGLPLARRLLAMTPGVHALYEDLENMETDVMFSDLDWTIVRPLALTDAPATGHYRVVEGAIVPKGSKISRADLAALVLKCAEGDLWARRAVAAAY